MKYYQEESSSVFLNNICKDISLFIFFLLVFLLYKIIFLFNFRAELADVSFWEIVKTLLFSVKFSLKTVGLLVFISFIFSSAVQQFYFKYPADKVRYIIGGIFLFIISLLCQIRIPYYTEFHVSFSPFVFNTFNDDVHAIFKTIIIQYGLFWRLGSVFVLTFALMFFLKYWLKLSAHLFNFINKFNPKAITLFLFILIIISVLFIRFDGNWSLSVYSDNTKKDSLNINHHLLKEALSDEIEAFYNAYSAYLRTKNIFRDITLSETKESLQVLSKGYKEDSLLPFLSRISKGPMIKKPKHIFLIVGENYALWPLLEKYNNLPIAENMRNILKKYDNIFIKKFISSSSGTMSSLSSIVMGLPSMGFGENTLPDKLYETSLFPQLNKLGYKTQFFYGGDSSWASVDSFVNNQGVEESYYASSFQGNSGVWGIDDKNLFKGILNKIDGENSFNLILTTSNHSPYPIDMSKETDITSKSEMEKFIDKKVTDKDLLITKMQNFEYMDKCICDFIETVLNKYPDSLFIVTGDHALRWNMESNSSVYEYAGVPLILIGKGLNAKDINPDAAGSHMDIAATLIELISPKGTAYFALGKDILHEQTIGVGEDFWISSKMIDYGWHHTEELLAPDTHIEPQEIEEYNRKAAAYKNIAAWRVLHGLELKEK